MFVTPLDKRRKEVLQAIVEAYIESAAPVSSQAIAQRLHQRISTATIRNVMAELDELGFVWQPHTSAGRIPTDQGYRYYIDTLAEIGQLNPEEKGLIPTRPLPEKDAFDELLAEFLHTLSNFSGYTALAFSAITDERLYIERTSCILEQPEFQNIPKLASILRAFEQQKPLLEIMRQDLEPDGVKVHIGKENPCVDIQECSLIVSNFKLNKKNMGTMGIIGPRRMSYPKAISTVNYITQALSERLSGLGI